MGKHHDPPRRICCVGKRGLRRYEAQDVQQQDVRNAETSPVTSPMARVSSTQAPVAQQRGKVWNDIIAGLSAEARGNVSFARHTAPKVVSFSPDLPVAQSPRLVRQLTPGIGTSDDRCTPKVVSFCPDTPIAQPHRITRQLTGGTIWAHCFDDV